MSSFLIARLTSFSLLQYLWLMAVVGRTSLTCALSALAGLLVGIYWQRHMQRVGRDSSPSDDDAADNPSVSQELRLLSKRLTESELRYQSIVEDQTEMVIRFDYNGTLTFANKSYREKNCLTDESIGNFNVFSVIHPDHRERARKKVQDTDIHQPFVLDVMRVVRKDGSIDWSEWRGRALFDAEGNHYGYQAVGRIVTDLVLAQRALEERESQYRSVVEDLREMILRCDANGIITFGNAAFARANDYELDDLVGRHCFERVHPDDAELVRRTMAEVSVENPFGDMEVRVVRANGDVQLRQWHGRARYDDEGQLLGFQGVGRDITDIHRTEARLQEKEQQLTHLARVSVLGEMVAGISHEINQPLATIANFSAAAALILDKEELPPDDKDKLQEWGKRVLKQTERISSIIQRLRRFARPGSQREFFAIADAANEALLVTEAATRNQVQRSQMLCSRDLPLVNADRIQIEQVLVNLIQNARDAMSQLPMAERQLSISAKTSGDWLVVTVTDSGPGVPATSAQDIFQSFVTSKDDGMGIGLAISRSIIEAHGGKIRAVTDAGHGQIEFTLPIEKPPTP